jgi:polyferredoxin
VNLESLGESWRPSWACGFKSHPRRISIFLPTITSSKEVYVAIFFSCPILIRISKRVLNLKLQFDCMEELIYFLAELIRIGGIILSFYCGYKAFKLEKEKNPEYKKYLYAITIIILIVILSGAIFSYILYK